MEESAAKYTSWMRDAAFGADGCKTYVVPTAGESTAAVNRRESASYVCYFFVFLLVLNLAQSIAEIGKYPAHALSSAIVTSCLVYILYRNCVRCNGVRGFLVVSAIGAVAGTLLDPLLPRDQRRFGKDP